MLGRKVKHDDTEAIVEGSRKQLSVGGTETGARIYTCTHTGWRLDRANSETNKTGCSNLPPNSESVVWPERQESEGLMREHHMIRYVVKNHQFTVET